MGKRTKTILIAGAGKGIGRAVADLAFEKGHEVLAVSRTEVDFQKNSSLAYQVLITDVGEPESLIELAPYADKMDIVINCTGTHPGLKAFSQHEDLAGETMETIRQNVLPALHLYQVFLPAFRQRGEGHFVHLSSGALDFHDPSEAGYCASKSALESLVHCLQNEDTERGTGVLHHAVRVSLTDTPLARKVCPDIEDWSVHYTARETAAYLLDVVLRPENYPKPIVPLPYKPVRL